MSKVGKSWQFAQWIRRTRMNFFYISSKYHIVKFHFRKTEWGKANQNTYQQTTSRYMTNQLKLPRNLATASNCKKTKTNMQKNTNVLDLWRHLQAEGNNCFFFALGMLWKAVAWSTSLPFSAMKAPKWKRFDLPFSALLKYICPLYSQNFSRHAFVRTGIPCELRPGGGDTLCSIPPHYIDQQLQMVITGDGQTLGAQLEHI